MLLRGRRLLGAKFRRQQPIGPYVVDFLCVEAGLVIEADGAHHFPPTERQLRRDALLQAAGFQILRFENCLITSNAPSVLDAISAALTGRLRAPLPPGEGLG